MPSLNYDSLCTSLVQQNPNLYVAWWLMAGHAYEVKDDPILSDAVWDWLCNFIDYYWDSISHQHKYLIDRPALSTSTAHYVNYSHIPQRIIGASELLRQPPSSQPPRRQR